MKIKAKYVEPKNYFSKEALKVFYENKTTIKGMRSVFCDDKYLILNDNNTERLGCIEMTHDALYSPNGDIKYRYYLLLFSDIDKSYQVFINKREYNKLFKVNDEDFLELAFKIINEDKRGKNVSHIRIVNIIIPQD